MKSKVKPEKLKLGDVLYFVDGHYLLKGVQKATVTTLSLNDKKEITFKTDNIIDTYDINGWHRYVSRSELKAKRVYNNLLWKKNCAGDSRNREIWQQSGYGNPCFEYLFYRNSWI